MFRTDDTQTLPAQPDLLRVRPGAFLPRSAAAENGHTARRKGKANGGEVGARLEHYLDGSDAVVLHQRRLPGKLRKINHIVVGPAGITVVDSRHYGGPKTRFERGELRVGKRNRTDLIERVLDQAAAVRELIAGTSYAEVDVEAALALGSVRGDPVVTTLDGRTLIVWGAGQIAAEASRPGPLSVDEVDALASYLAGELAG
jgi:Nuclease-related domain